MSKLGRFKTPEEIEAEARKIEMKTPSYTKFD